MNSATPTPTRSITMRPLSQQQQLSPSVACVGGMLRVLPESDLPERQSPVEETPPTVNRRATFEGDEQPEQQHLLTQKQVRELRRLCRKTANRAEFEDRLIQVRQIASIAAMGTPAAKFFDPQNTTSGSALRAWVELHRELGADWRDERPLPDDAIDELRQWDRGLKAWARLRFETPQHLQVANGDVASTTPSRPPGFSASPTPITPFTEKSKASEEEYMPFSSPVSPEMPGVVSSMEKPSAVPIRSELIESPAGPSTATPARTGGGFRRPMAEVSINRVGDTINITVPSAMMSNAAGQESNHDLGRAVARADQENVYPSHARKMSYLHAVNTAKSWRNNALERDNTEYHLTPEKEMAFRNAAKTLFPNSSKETASIGTPAPNSGNQRSEMDWAKLRRPALRPMSVNNAVNGQPLQKFPQ